MPERKKTDRRRPTAGPRPTRTANAGAAGAKTSLLIQIREMTLDDLPIVFALGERLFRAGNSPVLYRTWDEYELVDLFSSDGRYCLLAEHGDEIVGFVTGTVIEKRRSAWKYGYLYWLGVAPEYEGRGVALKLVGRLTELFIADGARMMLFDTEADNKRAIGFFERIGFANPVKHVYMTRNLTRLPEYRRIRTRPGPSTRRPGNGEFAGPTGDEEDD